MEEVYWEEEDDGLTEEELRQILDNYQKKIVVENLCGPGLSMVIHLVVLTMMFVYLVTKPRLIQPDIEVTVTEIETVELEKEVIEEINEVEEEVADEEAPSNEPTEAPADAIGAEDSLVDVSDDAPMTDDDVDADELLDVVRTDSPLKFSGPLGGRSAAGRKRMVKKFGGTPGGQKAVNRALRWLASVQNENGSWGNGNTQSAHTGLALLVFLAHGETPLSEQYGRTVQNAMRWLANYANDPGLSKKVMRRPHGYAHGIATYAISESYAMTKIPFLQTAMENSVACVIDGQQTNGGFDYGYSKGPRWDMSVSGWNFQALKAARVAGSTNEKLKDAIKKSIKFCRVTGYYRTGSAGSGFGYANDKGGKANSAKANMTGVGTVALQLLGAGKISEVKNALETIHDKRFEKYKEVFDKPGNWNKTGGDCLYGWYYDTQAVFNSQSDGSGKAKWRAWHGVFEKVLIRAQNIEGYWETDGQHGIGKSDIPGRVLATCLAALQLEVYYRYLPTFNIKKMDAAADKDLAAGDIDNVGAAENGGLIIEID